MILSRPARVAVFAAMMFDDSFTALATLSVPNHWFVPSHSGGLQPPKSVGCDATSSEGNVTPLSTAAV